MLHPFMPFITEELWNLTGTRENELIVARWPQALHAVDSEAQAEIDWLIRLIGAMRAARTELNVPPGAQLGVVVHGASDETRRRLDRQGAALARLGRVARDRKSVVEGKSVAVSVELSGRGIITTQIHVKRCRQ